MRRIWQRSDEVAADARPYCAGNHGAGRANPLGVLQQTLLELVPRAPWGAQSDCRLARLPRDETPISVPDAAIFCPSAVFACDIALSVRRLLPPAKTGIRQRGMLPAAFVTDVGRSRARMSIRRARVLIKKLAAARGAQALPERHLLTHLAVSVFVHVSPSSVSNARA
jgi:hypothetical protein